MCLPIRADYARAVYRKDNVQIGERRIMDKLVVGALQKARINCHDRCKPLLGHARSHRNSVAFGNANIEETFRVLLGKIMQARSVAHRGSDGADGFVFFRQPAEFFAKDSRKILSAFARHSQPRVKLADAVVALRLALGGRIALSLFCVYV